MKPPSGGSKALAMLLLLSMVLLLVWLAGNRPRAQAAGPQREKIVIVQQVDRQAGLSTRTVRVYIQEQPDERLQCRRVWQEDKCYRAEQGKA